MISLHKLTPYKKHKIIKYLVKLLTPVIESEGLILVNLEYQHSKGSGLLKLFIDRPYGKISLEECTQISHEINYLLNVENLISSVYRLEISSPGLIHEFFI